MRVSDCREGTEDEQVAVEGLSDARSGLLAEGIGFRPGRTHAELRDIFAGDDAELAAGAEFGAQHFRERGGEPGVARLARAVLKAENSNGAAQLADVHGKLRRRNRRNRHPLTKDQKRGYRNYNYDHAKGPNPETIQPWQWRGTFFRSKLNFGSGCGNFWFHESGRVLHGDWRDETIAALGNGFDETRIARVIVKRGAQAVQRGVKAAFEPHIGSHGPQPLAKVFTRDDLTGMLEKHSENAEGLFLKANRHAFAGETGILRVCFK
ncbi:MAG TPA: hypothetical protein VKS44_03400 [Candidatus Acidoferrales bacterium]|nr:hypothetical protein [Candidatus Acidoferrales bacterium]